MDYQFTQDWFSSNIPTWQQVMGARSLKPRKVLEIGSFEGRATTWIIDNIVGPNRGELYCVDTWQGSVEHDREQMGAVEDRFDRNVRASISKFPGLRVGKIKSRSGHALATLIAGGHEGTFEFIYVDGSHQAADVLGDLTLAFALCKVGGLIACDDYMWCFGTDPRMTPKMAVDAFVNCYAGRIEVPLAWLYQFYIIKVSD